MACEASFIVYYNLSKIFEIIKFINIIFNIKNNDNIKYWLTKFLFFNTIWMVIFLCVFLCILLFIRKKVVNYFKFCFRKKKFILKIYGPWNFLNFLFFFSS